MTAWLSFAALVIVPTLLFLVRWALKREQRAEDRAKSVEAENKALKVFVGSNFKREAEHANRVEKIVSGVSRPDAGRLLSTYPSDSKIPKTQ